ncbi:hypothetical protein PC129_g4304 [Phytophthora cactorum]|uniref:Uncharacterized protein n=1 Tax=Phytophthora cactorum TaxID=29920 RepID=A0A329RAT6_9STRA|nr:hypothetical protein PC112_g5594 [Phytophthora cactorum]KAG2837826.1 hypothetical protein PC111_g4502 [Phytophthora cactorum]KAG2922764.1 hypothetical protein PC114_g5100 [Phytophthora cactorum]KAG2948231.1 hypothetical protein PC117_g6191 [Phytophthora cactorum]KAG3029575.1 hypothetical protein PC120_g4260 [Phytophthora cactorum]
MSSQNEWNELEARYATPPAAEERSLRSRRRANRQRARLRLQQRQVRHRIETQESAAVAAGEEPVLALTQAELTVLFRRYATPSTGEDPAARRHRLANRCQAQRRLESRAAARRLNTDGGVAESALQPPMDGMSTDDAQLQSRQVQDRSGALPVNMVRSTTSPYSYEQLAAAVLNISAVSPHDQLIAAPSDALRNLTPDVPAEDNPSPSFPSYAQLNAALRNLSPDTPSQDTFAEGFPTYTQLAQALRDLFPATPSPINETSGFPTYAQLAAALRALPPVPTSRRIGVPRYAALGELSDFSPACAS